MNRKNQNTFQMFTQVAEVSANHVSLFPKNSPAAEIQKGLASGVKTLNEQLTSIVSAETAIRAANNDCRAARGTLKTSLTRASKVAAMLGMDKLQLPPHPADAALIQCGLAFVTDAEPVRKEFALHGVSVDAVAEEVNTLQEAMHSVVAARASRSVAKRLWTSTRDDLRGLVRRYDTLAEIFLEDNLKAREEYAVARTVPKTGGRKAAKTVTAAPPADPIPPENPEPASATVPAVATPSATAA